MADETPPQDDLPQHAGEEEQELGPGLGPGQPPMPRIGASAAFLVGLVLLAFLVVTAARETKPGPRLSRKAKLVDLIRVQDERTAALRRELDQLKSDLARLEAGSSGSRARLAELKRETDALAPFAGLAAVKGPGVRITLSDSSLRESPTGDPNDLVIHQQDIQAVVNGLWAGGAEGIAINGERLTAMSAVRCVGNTLLLHGSVYSPPYRVTAVGDPNKLRSGLTNDDGVERLRIVAEKFRLVYQVADSAKLSLPAFRGISVIRFAEMSQ